MPLASDITLDFNNMMAERIGPEGIVPSEIDALGEALRQTFRGHQDLRRLGQLPFRELPYQVDQIERIKAVADRIRSRFEAVLLLGTGGSSLGAACLVQALSRRDSKAGPRIEILEDLHEATWKNLTETLRPETTCMIVVSKSGKTIETLAAFLFFREWVREKKNILFITDPKQGPLREIAAKEGIETLPVPPGVGGRFSILSTVGLLPAACVGIDIEGLLSGARRMDERLKTEDVWLNPAMMSAALHFLVQRKGKKLRAIMPYDDRLRGYTGWFAQLWAESLGKQLSLKGEEVWAGSTPLKAEGSVDQHSQLQLYLEGPRDKVVTFLTVERRESSLRIPEVYSSYRELKVLAGKGVHELLTIQRQATEAALCRVGCPNLTIVLKELNPFTMGQLLYLAEVETVIAGALADINPFDQPGVEMIKNFIRGLLGVRGFEEYRQSVEGQARDRRFII